MTKAEEVVELNLGYKPEAAVSGAVLVQTECSTFLTFNAMRPTDRMSPWGEPYMEEAGTALVEFPSCSITKFGHPNDEAWSGIPRTHGLSYGTYEVLYSTWMEELAELNRHAFPETEGWTGRHFLLLFHDSSFECIAEGIKLEVLEEPYAEVFARIAERVVAE